MAAYPAPDQITALAPDAGSLKSGRELANPRKWTLLGGDAEALWGLAQGSGKEPYQTRVALDTLSTKCSCPSRKFPCKHALGLLFIAATSPADLTDKTRPPWLLEWLESRAERQEKSKERAEQKATGDDAVVDETAKAKRQLKRAGRVDDGVALLTQWLADLARRGLADSALNTHSAWDDIIRRMVDSQAVGLARHLRRASEAARSGDGWEARLTDHLGRLYLLLTAYATADKSDAPLRSEIEQQIGWTVPQDDVLASPPVEDNWLVAARTVKEEDKLVVCTTWLRGANSGRWAQVMRVSPSIQPVTDSWPPGRVFAGAICFYPGFVPLRALWNGEPRAASGGIGSGIVDTTNPSNPFSSSTSLVSSSSLTSPALPTERVHETFAALLTRYAHGLAQNPWRSRVPALVNATLCLNKTGAALQDETGAQLPLRADAALQILLLAITGGHRATLAVLWDGTELDPLTVIDDAGNAHASGTTITSGTTAVNSGTSVPAGDWVPLSRQTLER